MFVAIEISRKAIRNREKHSEIFVLELKFGKAQNQLSKVNKKKQNIYRIFRVAKEDNIIETEEMLSFQTNDV